MSSICWCFVTLWVLVWFNKHLCNSAQGNGWVRQFLLQGAAVLYWWVLLCSGGTGAASRHRHSQFNPSSMGIIMINPENPGEGRSSSMNFQTLDLIFHFVLLLLFQCWDWTDRGSDHDGDSDVSHWVQSACLSSRYCKNHERSKSHDDPNTCEYHPCCSVLQNNNVLWSSHIGWIFNVLVVDHFAEITFTQCSCSLGSCKNKYLRPLERSNSSHFYRKKTWKKSSSCFRDTWQIMTERVNFQ